MRADWKFVMHAQDKHTRLVASFRDEKQRLDSKVAGLTTENQKLHSNLATMQLQLCHYQQQVLCS